jgi:glycosidase
MATLLLTTRGTPVMYYGEEIGMRTITPSRVEDVRDMDAYAPEKMAATQSERPCSGRVA